ncbi:MAG: YfhO family protein [Chloroflexi bacterium]|nr:YfhO family protein [Chloroflexota bacterium]
MNSLAQRLRKFQKPGTARDLLSAFARSDALPLVLLAALVIIVFYDIVFLGRTLQTSSFLWGTVGARPPFGFPDIPDYNVYLLDPLATAVSSEPVVEKLSRTYRDLEIPLWNADTAMGRPLLASYTPELTNPLRLPIAIWPSPVMWDAYLLTRFWIAGAFAYGLARRMGMGRTGGLGAGAAYILSGYFMLYANMPHVDYAMMLPVLLFSFELLQERGTPFRLVFASTAIALMILVDNPEAAAIGLLVGAAFYLFRVAPAIQANRAAAVPKLGLFSLAALAGGGMTAVVLIPFLEFSGSLGVGGYSIHRHTSNLGLGTLHDPLRFMISLFIPYFNGTPVDNFQHDGLSGLRNYVSVVPVLLALLAVTRPRPVSHPIWFFAAAGTFFIAKTFGVPVVNWVGELPLLNVIDFGLYSGPPISLSVALLAGWGLQRLRDGDLSRHYLFACGAFLAILLAWLVWLNRDVLDTIPKSHLLFWTAVPASLVGLIATIYLLAERRLITLRTLAVVAALALTLEMALPTIVVHGELGTLTEETVGRRIATIERPQRHDPASKPPYIEFLQSDPSVYRVFGLDRVLYPNYSEAFGIADIRGFTAQSVKRYMDYIVAFIQPGTRSRFTGAYLPPLNSERDPPDIVGNPMFNLMNVKYVMTAAGRDVSDALDESTTDEEVAEQFTLVYEGEVNVYENLHAIPRAFLVADVSTVPNRDAALNLMSDASFDPSRTAIVETTASDDTLIALIDGEPPPLSAVSFEDYSDNSVRLTVRTDEPALLVLADTHYPGWRVTVDGERETIYPTNVAFRGVFIPSGTHTVEFTFLPASFVAGVAISLASIAIVGSFAIAWTVIARRRLTDKKQTSSIDPK